ncbi:MAG: UDP-3-O-acyl-N-acetylglucosamine deacetylase [Fimbriimonadales bacterium]
MGHRHSQILRDSCSIAGIGLHTGELCRIVLHPAEMGTGIWARFGSHQFPIRWDYVVNTQRATVVGDGGHTLSTVEHLMSALWALTITDCVVEVLQGREVPILDGSAYPFIEAIRATGLTATGVQVSRVLRQPAMVRQGERYGAVVPSTGTFATGYIQFPEPLGVQAGTFALDQFEPEIAPARTFGFLHEVEALRQQGLARGGSLDCALVIDQTGYHNPARFEDEPLRHKVLDAVGDLYLCGAHLVGFHLVVVKAGHALHTALAKAVAQGWQNGAHTEANDGGNDFGHGAD